MKMSDASIYELTRLFHKKVIEQVIMFIQSNFFRIEALIILWVLLFILGKMPYINILLTLPVDLFIMLIAAVLLFKIRIEALVIFTLCLFAIAFVLTLFSQYTEAEYVGNFIYFFLWVIVFQSVRSLVRQP